jgi:plasmid stabilization system protein ParE
VTNKSVVKFTDNFERNLEEIERFLADAELPKTFDRLLDELLEVVIPNLEHYPEIGRSFLKRPILST